MEQRDPRIDPRPGDVFRKGEEAVMVQFVTNEAVYLGEYDDETQSSLLGGECMPLDAFRRAAQEAEIVEAIDATR